MGYFFNTEGNNIIFDIHTAFMILLVVVVVIAVIKTFPKLIRARRSGNTGMIGRRVGKSFTKTESKIKKSQ